MMKSVFAIIVVSVLSWFGLNNQSKKVEMLDKNYPTYEKQWQAVEEQEFEGKPKSALELVEAIYKQAKKEENSPQIYKALMYQSKYTMTLEENSELTIVNRFKEEIATANAPEKQLLQSALATLYWQYYHANRWKFNQRTATDGGIDENDFRTWDLNHLFAEASDLYSQSLQDFKISQSVDIKDFDAILMQNIAEEEEIRFHNLRPSLYDLLAHRAIDFYQNDQSGLTKPAYQFHIQNEKAFGAIKQFLTYKPTTKDSLSNELKTIEIYQDLLTYHSKNKNKEALITINVERLNFVYQKSILENKDDLYETALKNLLKKYKNEDAVAFAGFKLAKFYKQQGNKYNVTNLEDENQWKLKQAIELCDEMIKKYPESLGANNCEVLKRAILEPHISIETANEIPTNTPFRTKINYTNIDNIYFRIANVTEKDSHKIQELYGDERVKYLTNLKGISNWESKTPNVGDHQNHSFEAMANNTKGLQNGHYVLLASADKDISNPSVLGYAFFQVTDIAYYQENTATGVNIYVKDRTTGKAIPNAKVTLKTAPRYRRNNNKFLKTVTANEQGIASFNIPKKRYSNYNLVVEISANQQKAKFGNFYYSRYQTYEKEWFNRALTFTDRSIYRPGQPIYFKGVFFQSNGEDSKLSPNEKISVTLLDANHQEVEELTLTTNEYGSISGSFVLPKGRLLGQYNINFNGVTNTYFNVEEYKRPKFEVEMKTLEGNYKLGDEITAEGIAKSYSGAVISNAKVNYRVVREVRYPYWGYYWWRPMPSSPSMEIANGEVATNDKGIFEIPFTAIPDKTVNLKDNPVFNYKIIADVTDINGETRSGNSTVQIGTLAMNLSIVANNKIQDNDENSIQIVTKNLNGAPLSAEANVSIYKLIAPSKTLISRLWSAPDQIGLNEQEFKQYFPNEPFDNQESNPKGWKNGQEVLTKTVTTSKDNGETNISLKTKKWQAGLYKIEVNAKDKFGKEITQSKFIEIVDSKMKKVADNQLFTFDIDKDSYEPGDVAKITLGSATDIDVFVQVIYEKNKTIHQELLTLNNHVKTISIPIKENYRGGIGVYYAFIKNNRFINGQKTIYIPHTNKELNIEVKTFRDKLQPNQEETWTFTVKGDKAEKVNAEFLANMYDASLDQFRPHNWFSNIPRRSFYEANPFGSNAFNLIESLNMNYLENYYTGGYEMARFRTLDFFGMNLGYGGSGLLLRDVSIAAPGIKVRGMASTKRKKAAYVVDGEFVENMPAIEDIEEVSVLKDASATALYGSRAANGVVVAKTKGGMAPAPAPENTNPTDKPIKARKNLQETAFFLPQLTTDKNGNVTFSFTTPEALTTWKFMAFAHTKELQTGMYEGETITQKELMVTPNAPRFFREGDEISFSSKISNITKKALVGEAELVLLDATTMQPIAEKLGVRNVKQKFSVDAEGNTVVTWNLTIPQDVPAVTYQVLAKAGNYTDGEENALPVLSNRMLVTESLPIALRSNQTKTFVLDKLANNTSNTLSNHKLTLEMTSNPAWYAVQSLPYLMEYPYECTEQMFSRYYANSVATHVANSNPKIQSVFNVWKEQQPNALLSNLDKNEELKSLILRETPWVREAQNEAEQKRRIALLFDLNKMASEQETALQTIQQRQQGNGGWAWFPGGRPNRYISQHIVAGFGHLDKLQVKNVQEDESTIKMVKKAIQYIDNELTDDFKELQRHNKNWKDTKYISPIHVHYFYTRSFFKDEPIKARNKEAFDFYFNLLKKNWLSSDLYRSGQMALAFHRYGENELAQKIMTSLDERSITSEELGMYWKSNTSGYFWYQAPIETQALMIEAFDEVANNQNAVDELKVWLLKNKQTNSWKTTKATTEAVYALLLCGGDWLAIDDMVELTIGEEKLDISKIDGLQTEAGTGYIKTSWNKGEITPKMATVTATKKGEGIAWGALYWQYFEDLDKITPHETPLKLNKKLFLTKNSDTGEKITPIIDGQTLNISDLVKIRIELRVDRDMEFVHMKDMRAAGFEPTNVLSQYKWQDGLGYYESTKDASTDFFFDYLPKGVYVFEYDLRVNNIGDFSNGITTIQCMYAPEFTSHSEGVRVKVE